MPVVSGEGPSIVATGEGSSVLVTITTGSGGGGGTFDGVHNDLAGRTTTGAHPSTAISGLGGAAVLNVGATAGTVAAGE